MRTQGVVSENSRKEKTGRFRVCQCRPIWITGPDREIWEPSYHVDKFASATGSGDSCIAGFLAALIKGETVESTVRYACALGAQNVRVFDAISGIKNWAETTAEMKSGWKKNKLVINDPGWRFDKAGQRWTGPGDTGKTA